MALQLEEMSNSISIREVLVETVYVGNHPKLVGSKGEAYYHLQNKYWAYRPDGVKVFYKIKTPHHLDCNTESSWIKCSYLGERNIGKEGKASFSEGEDAWVYKPKGHQETFLIKEDSDLKFRRDNDVFMGEDYG